MRILMVHNRYQDRGGEDVSVEAEIKLLRGQGEEVWTFFVSNDEIPDMNKFALAGETLWSSRSKKSIKARLREVKPDVVHFRNTFPLISPAAYYAAREEGVPIVQTLSNYRMHCVNALFLREGRACEDCLGKTVPWPGVLHSCYRGDRIASGVVASMITLHRALRTWQKMVDVYLAPSHFVRSKYIEGSLPADRIMVKPNFVAPDPGIGEGRGDYALYVGRLSHEKGVRTLLEACELLEGEVPVKIVGDGPLASEVSERATQLTGVEWLGAQSKQQTLELMKQARFLVLPSICYEVFPLVIPEAYAAGLPVIASNIGGMSSLIRHGRTGLHFRPADARDLAEKVKWTMAHPTEFERMRWEARSDYETNYTAERSYRRLIEIYEKAIENAKIQP